MAADMSRIQKHFYESLQTCFLCSKPYDNGNHQAKLLPCLHTFCKSCVQVNADDESGFNCEHCHKTINLPRGSVDGLPDNFLVEILQQHQDVMTKAASCGNCDRGDPAVSFCEDCDSFQCKTCVDYHSRMRSLQHHKLSNLAEEPREKQRRPVFRQSCTKHKAQPMDRYCKEEACQVLVCASCSQDDHPNHNIAELELVAKEIKTSMHDSSARVTDRQEELQNKKKTLEIAQKHLTSNFKIHEAEIEKCKKSLQDLMNSKFSEAQTNLKLKYDGEMSRLTEHIKSMDDVAAEMTSACDFTEKVCDITPVAQILTFHHQISARLQELENKELPEVIAKKSKFAFTGKHHSSMNKVKESLYGICDTGWKLQADPSHCTILSHGKREKSPNYWGRDHEATIQTADMYGEKLTHGGDKIDVNSTYDGQAFYYSAKAHKQGESLSVKDNKDGTYTFAYEVEARGNGTDVHVQIRGKHIQGSPFKERNT